MNVGDRIRILRKLNNLKQDELAEGLDVTGSAVGSWERNLREPSLETIGKLAKRFEVSADYLLGLTDDPRGHAKDAPSDLREFLDQQRVMFNGLPLTERDRQRVMDVLTGLFYDAMRK